MVLVAFIAGLLVGIAGDRFYLIRSRQLFPRRAADFAARRVVDRLDQELHLTAQQKSEVQRIIDRHRTRIDAIMVNVRPQVRQELETANAEIEKVLTPQQREQFSKIKMHILGPHRGMGPPRPH